MYLLPLSVTRDNGPTKATATRLKGTSINGNRSKGTMLSFCLPYLSAGNAGKCHMIDNIYGCHSEVHKNSEVTRVIVR